MFCKKDLGVRLATMNMRTILLLILLVGACSLLGFVLIPNRSNTSKHSTLQNDAPYQPLKSVDTSGYQTGQPRPRHQHPYKPRKSYDSSGSTALYRGLKPLKDPTSL